MKDFNFIEFLENAAAFIAVLVIMFLMMAL